MTFKGNAHITISIADGAKPKDTKELDFHVLEEDQAATIRGVKGFFAKDGKVHFKDPRKDIKEQVDGTIVWSAEEEWKENAETVMTAILYNTEMGNAKNAEINKEGTLKATPDRICSGVGKADIVAIKNKESGEYELYDYNKYHNTARPLVKTDGSAWTFDNIETSLFFDKARDEASYTSDQVEQFEVGAIDYDEFSEGYRQINTEEEYQTSRKFDMWIDAACKNVGYAEEKFKGCAEKDPAAFANLISMSDAYAEHFFLQRAFPDLNKEIDKYAAYNAEGREYGSRKEPLFMAFCRNLDAIEHDLDDLDHEKFSAVYETVYQQSYGIELPKAVKDRIPNLELAINAWTEIDMNAKSVQTMNLDDIADMVSQKFQIVDASGLSIGCEPSSDGIKQYMQVVKDIAARDYREGANAQEIRTEVNNAYTDVIKAVNEIVIDRRSEVEEDKSVKKQPIDKDRPILYVPVAIPGAGKSTWARTNEYCNLTFSSDEVRKELGFDAGKGNDVVFPEVRRRTVEALKSGQSCIYDATNLDFHRDELIRSIKEQVPNVRVAAVAFHVPLEECLERNADREGFARVPDHVIEKMNQHMTLPTKEAGFDNIIDLKWDKDHEVEAQKESMDKFADEVRNENRNRDVGLGYGED